EPLHHVLGNLLDNAREAVPSGGTITVSARRVELTRADVSELFGNSNSGPHVEVTVADTGPASSAEALRRFPMEPFVTTKPRHQGLGLAVVFRILHAHCGGFDIGSCPEKGTVVRVLLPVAKDPHAQKR